MTTRTMTLHAACAALLLLCAGGSAAAAARCTIVVDAVTMYESEPFAYHSEDPLFDDSVGDTAQARDFEAYVRSHYAVGGNVERRCSAYPDGDEPMRREGTYDMFGTTFRYIQTGYVPQAD